MLIRARSIINLPIIESLSLQKVASIRNILVDPENGSILSFLIGKKIFEKEKVLSRNDIMGLFADGILIRERENIVDYSEIIRAKKVIEDRIFLLGSRVKTVDGKKLGFLEDFLYDDDFLKITTLVIKKKFSNERRIVNADRIMEIKKDRITIRDAGMKMPRMKNGKIENFNFTENEK